MIAVESALAREQVDARLIMQVHDELVLEVRDGQADHVKALLRAQMESAAQLSVPLLVEVGMGANWDEAH